MVLFWVAILAISTLLYVLLDGLDLGVGIISGGAGSDARRNAMMNAPRSETATRLGSS